MYTYIVDGNSENVIICTYNAGISHYERILVKNFILMEQKLKIN